MPGESAAESVVSGGLSVVREEEIKGGQETILLVDDEDMIIDVGTQMMQSFGYEVLTAKGGKEAIEVYKAHRG